MVINSIIAVVAGTGCILAPARLLAMYRVRLLPLGKTTFQFWGATLLGLGMLTWSVRRTDDRGLEKAVASVLAMTYGISCVLAVRGQLAGANSLGWSTVALFCVLALAFAYMRFMSLRRNPY